MTEQALINEIKSLARRLRLEQRESDRERLESELARLEESLDACALRDRRAVAKYHEKEIRT